MKHSNITILITLSFFITGCGSQEPSSVSSEVPTVVELITETTEENSIPLAEESITKIEEIQPDPAAIYESTNDLVVAKSFEIKSQYDVNISYQNDEEVSVYLSICTEFTEQDGTITVNYNSCLLRTSVENDFEGKVTIPNDKERLVMAIWYVDDIDNPQYAIWENSFDKDYIREFIVN